MQHPQEPQRVYPDPAMYSPGTVPPNPYYVAPPPMQATRPGRFTVLRRGTRLVLRRSLHGVARVWRVARPYTLFLVIIALMGIVMSWMGLRLLVGATAAPVVAGTSPVGPSPAVESFIKGHQSFNADEMWSSYSPDYQIEQIQQGFTKKSLELIMDKEQTDGLRIGQYKFVGSTTTNAGAMHFYTIDVQVQNRMYQIPWIFNVDKDGQIIELEGKLLSNITPHTQTGN